MIEKLLEDIKALQEALQILSKIRNYMASRDKPLPFATAYRKRDAKA